MLTTFFPSFDSTTSEKRASYVWYLNICSCQCNMWADKYGWDVSSAMGVSSQVGNILTSRLCVYVCEKRCRGWVCDECVWRFWTSGRLFEVPRWIVLQQLHRFSFCYSERWRLLDKLPWSTTPPPKILSSLPHVLELYNHQLNLPWVQGDVSRWAHSTGR